jgi:hypothetical protein
MNTIWFKDILKFISFSNMKNFIPTSSMNTIEKLNAYVLLSIYVTLIHYTIFNDSRVFGLTVITMLLTYLYYKSTQENYVQYQSINNKGKINKNTDCSLPSDNNPFMNVLMNEYADNPERREACDVDENKIKRVINDKYFKDTYRDVDDVFDRKSSFRNFYTMPNTSIPNDQTGYAQWLYGIKGKTQKEGNGDRNMYFASYY